MDYDKPPKCDSCLNRNNFGFPNSVSSNDLFLYSCKINRKCQHKKTGKWYAVKIVSRRINVTTEILLLQRCQGHRNIVELVEVFTDDVSEPVFCMC